MKKALIAITLTAGSVAHAEVPLQDRYPGPWKDDPNLSISKALAQNSVRGCGEFKYRESRLNRGEYLVYCTRDGSNWTAYLVWTSIAKITGPHQISASIPP